MTEQGKGIATIGDAIGLKEKAKKLGWGDDVTPPTEQQSPDDSGDKSNGRTEPSGKEASDMATETAASKATRKKRAPATNGQNEIDESEELEFSNWDHFTGEAAKAAGRDGVGTVLKTTGLVIGGVILGKVTGATALAKSGAEYIGKLLTGDDESDAE